jgi:hypothetical protein
MQAAPSARVKRFADATAFVERPRESLAGSNERREKLEMSDSLFSALALAATVIFWL